MVYLWCVVDIFVGLNRKGVKVFMNVEKMLVVFNVDYVEIVKFEVVVLCWWDLEGEFKLFYCINLLWLGYIVECFGGLFGKKVFDVGCGGGIFVESMVCEGVMVIGLDMGVELLQVVRLYVLESGIQVDYVQEIVEEYVVKYLQQYDVVICMEMLEYVFDLQLVVYVCVWLVKFGGQVFFFIINCNGKVWLMVVVGVEYVMKMVFKGIYDVKKFIKLVELLGWVDQIILKEQYIIGLYYNLLINIFKLVLGVDVNYMLYIIVKQD